MLMLTYALAGIQPIGLLFTSGARKSVHSSSEKSFRWAHDCMLNKLVLEISQTRQIDVNIAFLPKEMGFEFRHAVML